MDFYNVMRDPGEKPEIKFHTISKTAGIEVIEIVRAKDLARHNSGG